MILPGRRAYTVPPLRKDIRFDRWKPTIRRKPYRRLSGDPGKGNKPHAQGQVGAPSRFPPGRESGAGCTHCGASKAGHQGLTKSLMAETAAKGGRAHKLRAPGFLFPGCICYVTGRTIPINGGLAVNTCALRNCPLFPAFFEDAERWETIRRRIKSASRKAGRKGRATMPRIHGRRIPDQSGRPVLVITIDGDRKRYRP